MPAVEEVRIDFDAAPILLHRAAELADREVAIRVIKKFIQRFHRPRLFEFDPLVRPARAHRAVSVTRSVREAPPERMMPIVKSTCVPLFARESSFSTCATERTSYLP